MYVCLFGGLLKNGLSESHQFWLIDSPGAGGVPFGVFVQIGPAVHRATRWGWSKTLPFFLRQIVQLSYIEVAHSLHGKD